MGILRKLLGLDRPSARALGRQGESSTAVSIDWNNYWACDGRLLRNVYVPRDSGSTSEIDVLYITRKGLFVLEVKNYSGLILGREQDRNWVQLLNAGRSWFGRRKYRKYSFFNPIRQNQLHIDALSGFLDLDIPIFSVVVFSDRCDLSRVELSSEDLILCQLEDLPGEIRFLWRTHADELTETQVNRIYQRLQPLTHPDRHTRKAHIRSAQAQRTAQGICPLCGARLVRRTSRTGHPFLGCTNYPNCHYTQDL